jgi:hypothetical protein
MNNLKFSLIFIIFIMIQSQVRPLVIIHSDPNSGNLFFSSKQNSQFNF